MEHTELHQQYRAHLSALMTSMTQAMTGLPPGARRLLVAVEAYWETCWRQRETRRALNAAAERSGAEAALAQRARIFEHMLASELSICGVPDPYALAPTLVAEIRDIAGAELRAGHRLPWQRRRLVGFLEERLGELQRAA